MQLLQLLTEEEKVATSRIGRVNQIIALVPYITWGEFGRLEIISTEDEFIQIYAKEPMFTLDPATEDEQYKKALNAHTGPIAYQRVIDLLKDKRASVVNIVLWTQIIGKIIGITGEYQGDKLERLTVDDIMWYVGDFEFQR